MNYLTYLPKFVYRQEVDKENNVQAIYTTPDYLLNTANYLRNNQECQYKQLMDITAVDYPEKEKRFLVVYHFLSVSKNKRLMVKVWTDEITPLPSLFQLYSCATWYERETYDMFGVYFLGNPDMRRILTDYGFEGHPLRKDFPLTGFTEVRYDDEEKRILSEPVQMSQQYRTFNFQSPWSHTPNLNVPNPEDIKKVK